MVVKDKTAVITGASRGIGREIALKLAGHGADIAVIYSGSEDAANEVVEIAHFRGVKAKAYKCDVSDSQSVKEVCAKIIDDFQNIDILVNNAGITKDSLLIRMSVDDFDNVINVNLKGTFNFTKNLSKAIMKSASGRIINISSVVGISGNAGQANYSAAKAGIVGITKTLAKELAPRNVTVNAIAPGFIETDMTASLSEAAIDHLHDAIPLKRLGHAEDVANLALFLASDMASYITGEVIRVDGGMCI